MPDQSPDRICRNCAHCKPGEFIPCPRLMEELVLGVDCENCSDSGTGRAEIQGIPATFGCNLWKASDA